MRVMETKSIVNRHWEGEAFVPNQIKAKATDKAGRKVERKMRKNEELRERLTAKGYEVKATTIRNSNGSLVEADEISNGNFTAYVETVGAGFVIYDDIEDSIVFMESAESACIVIALMHEKKEFVELDLTRIIKQSDKSVKRLHYTIDGVFNEFVIIEYKDDSTLYINVSADSKQAILKDVVAKLF